MFWALTLATLVIIILWHTHYHACSSEKQLNGLSLCDSCVLETEMFWEDFT